MTGPHRAHAVIVDASGIDETYPVILRIALSAFLFSASACLLSLSGWLFQTLLTYRACGWVFSAVVEVPKCLR